MQRSHLIIITTLLIIIVLAMIAYLSWSLLLPTAPLPPTVNFSTQYQHPKCDPTNVSQNVVTALIKPSAICGIILRSSNQTQLLFDNAAKFDRLQIITAANIGLTEVPDTIGQFSALQTLDLNNNELKDLPTSLSNLTSLRLLNLRNNRFSDKTLEQIQQQTKAEVIH